MSFVTVFLKSDVALFPDFWMTIVFISGTGVVLDQKEIMSWTMVVDSFLTLTGNSPGVKPETGTKNKEVICHSNLLKTQKIKT